MARRTSSSSSFDGPGNGAMMNDAEEMIRSMFLLVLLVLGVYFLFPYETFQKKKQKYARKALQYYEDVEDALMLQLSRLGLEYHSRKEQRRRAKGKRHFRKQGKLDRIAFRRPTFDTMNHRTIGVFEPVVRPTSKPDFKSGSSWYWNINDEYVIRSSDHWSNNGHKIGSAGNWWVLDPEYYNQHCSVDNKKTTPQSAKDTPAAESCRPMDSWLTGKCKFADLSFYHTFHIDFENFYVATRCSYEACARPREPPHFVSPSGSEYWETDDHQGVIRCSDHWSNSCGLIATCWWIYEPVANYVPRQRLSGRCDYKDFSINGRRFVEVFFSHPTSSSSRKSNSIQATYGNMGRKLVNDRRLKEMLAVPEKDE